VEIRTLEQLTNVSETVRCSGPIGFNLAGTISESDAVIFEQHVIAAADLHDDVPVDVHQPTTSVSDSFTSTAPWNYELFTIVDDRAPLVLEHVLGTLFTEDHVDGLPLVDRQGADTMLQFSNFDELFAQVRWMASMRSTECAEATARPHGYRLASPTCWRGSAEGMFPGKQNRWRDSSWFGTAIGSRIRAGTTS
jgi:hypothetical protein